MKNLFKLLFLLLLAVPCLAQDLRPSAYIGRPGVVTVRGGKILGTSGGVTTIAGVDLTPANNATTFIFIDLSGTPVLSNNTTGFPASSYFPICTVIKDANGVITSFTDNRPDSFMAGGAPAGANTQVQFNNNGAFGGSSQVTETTGGSCPLTLQNATATNVFSGVANGGFCNWTLNGDITAAVSLTTPLYKSSTNCSSSASPAVCASAASGSVVVAAGATTVVVNTTAVTANSQVQLTFDSSLGAKLAVTCNTTIAQPTVSARVGGTSFTITLGAAPVTNPACFSYTIVN